MNSVAGAVTREDGPREPGGGLLGKPLGWACLSWAKGWVGVCQLKTGAVHREAAAHTGTALLEPGAVHSHCPSRVGGGR